MKTVKVRIAVAVDSQGNWSASGWSENGDQVYMAECMAGHAQDGVNEGGTVYWVEAELPISREQVIQGEVFENE